MSSNDGASLIAVNIIMIFISRVTLQRTSQVHSAIQINEVSGQEICLLYIKIIESGIFYNLYVNCNLVGLRNQVILDLVSKV